MINVAMKTKSSAVAETPRVALSLNIGPIDCIPLAFQSNCGLIACIVFVVFVTLNICLRSFSVKV